MNKIAWGAKVPREFLMEVIAVCSRLNWSISTHPTYLMSCMAFESGETFSPTIRNMAGSGATGLIQFMPYTAKDLGTSVELLVTMTAVEQLFYVEKYFKPYKKRIHTLSDMYMAILLPKYIGADEETRLFVSPTKAYRQNAGLDRDKNGYITKAEAASKVTEKMVKGLKEGYYTEVL